jgi:bisphosphoglycerate-dependent phosphoglycerate mutase
MDVKNHRKSQLLFIRHARRHVVKNMETQHHVLLTGKGKKDARRFGKRIALYHDNVIIFHSPIERCIQTAEHICKGIEDRNHCTIGGTIPVLGGHYLAKNPDLISDYFNRYGNITFLRKWFDNEFDEDIIIPYGEVAYRWLRPQCNKTQSFKKEFVCRHFKLHDQWQPTIKQLSLKIFDTKILRDNCTYGDGVDCRTIGQAWRTCHRRHA